MHKLFFFELEIFLDVSGIKRKSAGFDFKRMITSTLQKFAVMGNDQIPASEIEKKWDEFISILKEANIHVPALLRSTKTLDFDGENLTLEVFYRFHKDKLEEPKIIKMLNETISQVMGASIKFKFILAKKEAKLPAAVARSNVVDIKEDELAQIAREIFSK